jgi:hypothetical protein
VAATAGLNEIKSRLLARSEETPLCAMFADLIVASWRNPGAHEELYWDPDPGLGVFGGRPTDFNQVRTTADLAWAAARGFQAGVQVGCSCLPDLAHAIDRAREPPSPVGRNIVLVKLSMIVGRDPPPQPVAAAVAVGVLQHQFGFAYPTQAVHNLADHTRPLRHQPLQRGEVVVAHRHICWRPRKVAQRSRRLDLPDKQPV